jgi:hypothetical protein
MVKRIIAVLVMIGIVVMIIGLGIGYQFELKEELYYQPGQTVPSVRTVTVYPYALEGIWITLIGGILELIASIIALLSWSQKEESVSKKDRSKAHE